MSLSDGKLASKVIEAPTGAEFAANSQELCWASEYASSYYGPQQSQQVEHFAGNGQYEEKLDHLSQEYYDYHGNWANGDNAINADNAWQHYNNNLAHQQNYDTTANIDFSNPRDIFHFDKSPLGGNYFESSSAQSYAASMASTASNSFNVENHFYDSAAIVDCENNAVFT